METLLTVIGAAYVTVLVVKIAVELLWKIRERDKPDTEDPEADPCETCLRWPECNGVDRNTCPNCGAPKEG